MSSQPQKRKATTKPTSNNKSKRQKNWSTSNAAQWSKASSEIHIGDAGVWVTCDRNREGKCAAEVLDLFGEYALRMYGDAVGSGEREGGLEGGSGNGDGDEDEDGDIEDAISAELGVIRTVKSTGLFKVIRLDVACVLFIRVKPPIDPVKLVHAICKDAASGTATKRCRFVKRLTPATLTEKAHERNFEDLATRILKPVFHEENSGSKKFAIRYTSRNHSIMTRDDVIKRTAELVGDTHKVDLDHPDVVILVDIYKNICTMAIVDGDYNDLKKYNLAEIGSNPEEKLPSNGSSRLVKKEIQPKITENDLHEISVHNGSVVESNDASAKDETGNVNISSK